MRRALIVLLALVLGGCATYHHDGGYYDRSVAHGDYYYEPGPVTGYGGPGWYGPYDTLFWGLRYSYFDPFWYPNFHYGVTFFPSYYYGWPYWNAGSYWHWRGYHPYSPHYGSWWDHYYHWQPSGPRRNLGPGSRGYGGNGPERYGSARNAAERMAQGRTGGDGWASPAVRKPGSLTSRQRAGAFEAGGLPSSRYVPRSSYQRVDGYQRSDGVQRGAGYQRAEGYKGADGYPRTRAGDVYRPGPERQQRGPVLERGSSSATGPAGAMRFRQSVPSRSALPAPPAAQPWLEPSRAPAFRSAPRAPEFRSKAASERASRAEPSFPSRSGSMGRSSPSFDRGASRSRGER